MITDLIDSAFFMNKWWLVTRPKTLLASLGPVLLASSLASRYVSLDLLIFTATLLCALFLQISVNLANDLSDGLSGVDNVNRLGPQRGFQSGLINLTQFKIALGICVSIAVITGLFLVNQGGIAFLILGVFSLLGVYCYSAGPFPLASNALGEATVFVFFGLVAVMGCFYLQTEFIDLQITLFACVLGTFSSALMLVNNIRDIATDEAAGKMTLAVRLKEKKSKQAYKFLLLACLVFHLAATWPNLELSLAPAALLILFIKLLFTKLNNCRGREYNELLAKTALFAFLYALVTAVCILIWGQ